MWFPFNMIKKCIVSQFYTLTYICVFHYYKQLYTSKSWKRYKIPFNEVLFVVRLFILKLRRILTVLLYFYGSLMSAFIPNIIIDKLETGFVSKMSRNSSVIDLVLWYISLQPKNKSIKLVSFVITIIIMHIRNYKA